MHQHISYKEQFTPWIPNSSVLETEVNADHLMLSLCYYIETEDFTRYEFMNDVLFSSLYANGVCRILISKSQKDHNRRL